MPEPEKPKQTKEEKKIFDEIEAEIAELEEDFGDLGLDDDDAATQQTAKPSIFRAILTRMGFLNR